MQELVQKILTEKTARGTEEVKALAAKQTDFGTWS